MGFEIKCTATGGATTFAKLGFQFLDLGYYYPSKPTAYYPSAQRLDLFAWCVRLSRLLVGFRTHFKSLHFHSFIHSFYRKKLDRSTQFGAVGYIISLYSSKSYVKRWRSVQILGRSGPPSSCAHDSNMRISKLKNVLQFYDIVVQVYSQSVLLCRVM